MNRSHGRPLSHGQRTLVRGISMAEVLVASSAFLMVMLIGLGALKLVKRTSDHLQNRSLPRQQLRLFMGHLQRNLRASSFIFSPNQTLNFGPTFQHPFGPGPTANPADPAAHDLVYALPETADASPLYNVQAIYLQPDNRAFQGAHRVVMASVAHQAGMTPGSPADIPLASMPPTQSEVRTFATASPADGLRVRKSSTLDGLLLELVIGHKTEGESVIFETYQAQLTMRNNR